MDFLCSFRPLAASTHGRAAARQFNLPPFIDASCRREPDLQSQYPSISALCRIHKPTSDPAEKYDREELLEKLDFAVITAREALDRAVIPDELRN